MAFAGLCTCRPLNQFCCGCSLDFGVKAILILHLLQSIFYIATTVSNIVLQVPTFGYDTDLAKQTFNAAFALAGLPFILVAWYGVNNKAEAYVRFFLYYLFLQFVLDMAAMMYYLVIVDTCTMLPSGLKQHGSAFACGIARIMMLTSVFVIFGVDFYFMYCVWSYSEDLKVGARGQGLPELLLSKGKKSEHYHIAEGLFGVGGSNEGPYPLNYGSLATPGVGGSSRIFGGSHHETDFPPRAPM